MSSKLEPLRQFLVYFHTMTSIFRSLYYTNFNTQLMIQAEIVKSSLFVAKGSNECGPSPAEFIVPYFS